MGVCLEVAICLTLASTLCLLQLDIVSSKNTERDEATEEDDFENVYGIPGVQFEYRFEVGAGTTQCFYQKLQQDARLSLAFEVNIIACAL